MNTPLPTFPEEKVLELNDFEAITEVTFKFPPYSDFNFTSLYVWDVEETIRISELNGNLIVKFRDYVDGSHFYSLIGNNELDESCRQLIRRSQELGFGTQLRLVPDSVAKQLSTVLFDCKEDPDNNDYVLDINHSIEIDGSKNHQKKRRINKFVRENPNAHVIRIDLNTPSTLEDVIGIFESWAISKGQSLESEDVQDELQAVHRLVKASSNLNLFVSGLYINDVLRGFSISELLNDAYAIGHFEKADRSVPGSFQYLQYEHAKNLKNSGVELFNIEQDLGIEGLRTSKMSHDPVKFLKKYIITTNS